MAEEKEMAEEEAISGIARLPENCISHVISLTSPVDCCRSAAVSTVFHSAADSDTVWEHFLPSDYEEMLSQVVNKLEFWSADSDTVWEHFLPSDYEEMLSQVVNKLEFWSKKELYFRLCLPILIEGKKKSFWLERLTGRKCYTLSARELEIDWGETSEYWKPGHFENSRFPEVPELSDIRRLDIKGRIDCKVLSRRTNYAVYLIFKLDRITYGFGFPSQNALVSVGSQSSRNQVCLGPKLTLSSYVTMKIANRQYTEIEEIISAGRAPNRRPDGWMEMELGEFFSGDGNDGEVEMVLWETESRQWKSGLIVEGIEVRPK